MGLFDLINHLLNFAAPALWVGTVLALLAPFVMRNRAAALSLHAQAAINSLTGVMALGVGLWFFGRDGKMASYAAMLITCVVSQGFLRR